MQSLPRRWDSLHPLLLWSPVLLFQQSWRVLYGMCGRWLGGAISRQSWEPSSRGAGYQGASTPIKTVKRMINWFILRAVWRVGEQADYFGGWGLLCLKLSWSSYHNLGESSPTNILFVPKYKSQSRLVLCSKHKHRGARVEISEKEVNALLSNTIYDCFHTTKINWEENTFIHISRGEWRLHNLWIWGPHKSAHSQYLVCSNCQREALFHLTMVNATALFTTCGRDCVESWTLLGLCEYYTMTPSRPRIPETG